MIKKFGVKEAKEASKFARTSEQKLTVLATMAMLGIRNEIKVQLKKVQKKSGGKVTKGLIKVGKVRSKLHKAITKQNKIDTVELTKIRETTDIYDTWTI